MSDATASRQSGKARQDGQQPAFQIEKLYVKDLSLEVPNAPQVFMEQASPQLEVQVRNEAAQSPTASTRSWSR